MSKTRFTPSIQESLNNRDKTAEQELETLYGSSNSQVSLPISGLNDSSQNEIDKKSSEKRTLDSSPIHNHSTTNIVKSKRSNAGRKKKANAEKKKQMTLTLSPDTYNKLIEWADSKPRSAPNYVSDFVEEHLSKIIK